MHRVHSICGLPQDSEYDAQQKANEMASGATTPSHLAQSVPTIHSFGTACDGVLHTRALLKHSGEGHCVTCDCTAAART
jgi:hypothetical protein